MAASITIISIDVHLTKIPLVKRTERGWRYLWGIDIRRGGITTLYRPLFETWSQRGVRYIEGFGKLVAITRLKPWIIITSSGRVEVG